MNPRGETWVLATGNQGKVNELQALLAPLGITLKPQSDFGIDSAAETGTTYVENAIIKARHAAALTGLPALADDSGLDVAILNGEPGIHSSRYAGEDGNAARNIEKLLDALKHHEGKERRAAFHCVIVFMRHADDPAPIIADGRWLGEILPERRGQGGFGYDPVFLPEGMDRAAAELDKTEKNAVSHRGQALRQLLELLQQA